MYLPTSQQSPTARQSSDPAIPLAHTIKLPVSTDDRGPIPQTPPYLPIHQIGRTGFSFKFIQLLHAIGCKTASLPSREKAECVSSAYLFTKLLRLTPAGDIYSKELYDSDLQTPRSQELGIGMLCLFARHFWKIPWDALEPIPGKGKRFDYRGQTKNLKAIFEAKGTRYRKSQPKQISDGLAKKKAHHKRGEHHDVELVISTHIGGPLDRSRILLADPEFPDDEFSFGPEANDFFRLRHYARVLHFVGAPSLGYQLRQEADLIYKSARGLSFPQPDFRQALPLSIRRLEEPLNLSEHTVGESSFLGTWYESWLPPEEEGSHRNADAINLKLQRLMPSLKVFQGIRSEIIQDINNKGPLSILNTATTEEFDIIHKDDAFVSSIFTDGSVLSLQYL
jgi:hypothetical protein